MKSIERRFKKREGSDDGKSTFIHFCEAVKHQGFSSRIIQHWFNKLVSRDDYDPSDKMKLLKHLYRLTNLSEEGMFRGQKSSARRVYSLEGIN